MPRPDARIETGSRTSDHIELTTADLRLVVAPALGGRIVSLEDRRTGHDWLVADPSTAADADLAGWGTRRPRSPASARSAGMSACRRSRRAPTRSIRADPRCATTVTAGAGPPRSLGSRPRQPWQPGSGWHGRSRPLPVRALVRLDGPTVRTDYRMMSLGPDMPFLWSMHPLLALEPGARLALRGVHRVAITNATGFDLGSVDGTVDWPLAGLTATAARPTCRGSRGSKPGPHSRPTPGPPHSTGQPSRSSPTARDSRSSGIGRPRRSSAYGSTPEAGRPVRGATRSRSSRPPLRTTISPVRWPPGARPGRGSTVMSRGGRRSASSAPTRARSDA